MRFSALFTGSLLVIGAAALPTPSLIDDLKAALRPNATAGTLQAKPSPKLDIGKAIEKLQSLDLHLDVDFGKVVEKINSLDINRDGKSIGDVIEKVRNLDLDIDLSEALEKIRGLDLGLDLDISGAIEKIRELDVDFGKLVERIRNIDLSKAADRVKEIDINDNGKTLGDAVEKIRSLDVDLGKVFEKLREIDLGLDIDVSAIVDRVKTMAKGLGEAQGKGIGALLKGLEERGGLLGDKPSGLLDGLDIGESKGGLLEGLLEGIKEFDVSL